MTISYALIAECESHPSKSSSPSIQVVSETSRQRTLRSIIEQKIIPKLATDSSELNLGSSSRNNRLVLTHEMFTFYIKRESRNQKDTYYVVISTHDEQDAALSTRHRVCWSMIEAMSREYHESMENKSFKPSMDLQALMKYHNNPENDKILKLHLAIEEVKNTMMINVDTILDNHKKMHELIVETDSLREQGELWRNGGRKLKWSMTKRWLIIGGIAVGTVVIGIGLIALILALAL
ncbi:hypothetical protein C9374_013229 [Naegleria lovaniensis]|uniref:V-SNARE coiled-coil homology domain-containing protein n=1 Tax=Naegleria lovaniensis TaxID=51637 RepID=A0AA88H0V9_NAELO|nr:uncharacterized protein C9374_013229 [Naegleria lovaniensis]KAG2391744.1 hypothetical protein C9374_013229 [Naegleria lovaniensis]